MKSPVRAKKHLGQHFLTDSTVSERMAAALEIKADTRILEIGPGTAALTTFLFGGNLKLVEIDKESVEFLKNTYPNLVGKIIEGDFLKMELADIFDNEEFTLCGNFPYNISSQILFKTLDNRELIPVCVGMFQKEVAMRIASGPKNKDYGILSVLIQAYYEVEYLFTVSEGSFNPPPKVKSGVLKLVRKRTDWEDVPFSELKKIVKIAFNQRRKTLRNALKGTVDESLLQSLGFDRNRAEELSVADFLILTRKWIESR
jgi:16S rRNA (adenine1518-N6/adenine1519-N6)-dimethyltransferase